MGNTSSGMQASGRRFFSLGLRLSREFRISSKVRVEGLVEGFNLTNHENVITRNTNFGTGAYPTNPLPSSARLRPW